MAPDAGHFRVLTEVKAELSDAVAELATNPLPLVALKPDHIDIPATRTYMAKVKKTLTDGVGFALINHMPIEPVGDDGAQALFWLMGSTIEWPGAQKWMGNMIYDVTDTGRQPRRD